MKVTISRSKNTTIYYISKSIRLNGKSTTRTVERLGTEEEVRERAGGMDPYEWAKQYAAELTRREKEMAEAIRYSPTRLIRKNASQTTNISFLFPQDIYYNLRIHEICAAMEERYGLPFDLNEVFSRLIYTRVVYHASKHRTITLSKRFLDQPHFKVDDINRALHFLGVSPLTFQRELYRKMTSAFTPDSHTLYYDCTNYYLEIMENDLLKSPSHSSEDVSTPIIQLGLLTDASGIPLSFDMLRDTESDPPDTTSLERSIIYDLKPERLVVCSEGGLTRISENKFDFVPDVRFVHVESARRIPPELRLFALDVHGWKIPHRKRLHRIDRINEDQYANVIFYKEKEVTLDGKKQRMIATYSLSQRNRQRWVRQRQLTRVRDIIETAEQGGLARDEYRQRLVSEERYDGFSVIFTDFDESAASIIPVIQRRSEIEENFRTVKRELRSSLLNLNDRQRLYAHFMICFVSSIIERIIEIKLKDQYSYDDISDVLREMDMLDIPSEGYIPVYSRTDLTDALHEAFGFRTDNQITSGRTIRKLSADTRKVRPLDL